MTDTRTRVLSLLLTVLVVVGTVPAMSVGPVAASTGNTAGNTTTFHVEQGSQCYEVTPVTTDDQNVSEFYDYRSNETSPEGKYSSYGTGEYQKNQASNLFVYEGENGYSLVFLHDELSETGDAPHASTITFVLDNMSNGEWVVRDDTYGNDTQDDDWDTSSSTHDIDWKWGPNRTDGGAFQGFGDATITITPKFNEAADDWGNWPFSGDGSDHYMQEWRLLDGDGSTKASLNMNQQVSISKGSCPDETDPSADLTASPNPAGNNEEVTLDASGSSDDEGIASYEWDFDGDGTMDDKTSAPTVTHTYSSTGDHNTSVKVIDGAGNSDVASVTVTVEAQTTNNNITYLNGTAVEIEGTYEAVDLTLGYYTEDGYGQSRYVVDNVSGTTVVTVPEDYGVNGTMINHVSLYKENFPGSEPEQQKEHPRKDYYAETIEPYGVDVSVENVTETGNGTYEVTFGYDNPNEEYLNISNSTFTSGNVSGEPPATFESGQHTFTTTWTPDSDDERATWTLNRSVFDQSAVSASTQRAGDIGNNSSTQEGIEFVNASTIKVTGDYDSVVIETDYYNSGGLATERIPIDNVSGTTIISAPDTGINGTAISSAGADEDGDGIYEVSEENPFDYEDQIKPYSVNVSVESVTETGNGTYEVTFGYTNPNEEWLYMADSQYTTGNVSGEPPRKLYSGENTTTVTWTPDSDDERVTWEVDQSNFGLPNVSASTQRAGDVGDGGSDAPDSDAPPTANLTAGDTGALSKVFSLDASGSTDDEGIERYKYDIDGDGTFEWFGGKMTGVKAWKYYEEPGTYTATVRVWDSEGQTDTDSVTFTIEKRDHTKPEAAIDVSDTVEVGQTVTFEATDFTEGPKTLAHICWEMNGSPTVDGRTWNTSFDETGEKQVTLVLKDRAGNLNEITTTITVVADDSNDGSNDDGTNDGDSNPDEGGVSDGDDIDSRTDGLPGADPGSQDDENESQNDGTTSAPLTDDDGGEIVVESMDAKSEPSLEVDEAAPASVESPTPADDGFEALSYLNVTDASRATFTVSKAQLNESGATADAVSLFHYQNGSWTAVETAQVNATDDAYEFSANVSNGTYAVGIDRPATNVTSVALSSQRVEPGKSVTVFVTVENTGRADGTRTVNLTVGGEVVATENVSVGAGEKELVSFERTFDASGVYEVSVDDEATELVVEGIETNTTTTTTTATTTEDATGEDTTSTSTTTNDSPGVPGFGVGVSLVALLGAALLALRRR